MDDTVRDGPGRRCRVKGERETLAFKMQTEKEKFLDNKKEWFMIHFFKQANVINQNN